MDSSAKMATVPVSKVGGGAGGGDIFEDTDIPLADADPTLVISDDAGSSSSPAPTADILGSLGSGGSGDGEGGCYLNEDARKSKLWRRSILGDDCESMDSIPSMLSDQLNLGSSGGGSDGGSGKGAGPKVAGSGSISDQMHRHLSLDPDFSPDEVEEKARLIAQVFGIKIIGFSYY